MSMLALKLDLTMIVRYVTTATMTVHWVGTHAFDISKPKKINEIQLQDTKIHINLMWTSQYPNTLVKMNAIH